MSLHSMVSEGLVGRVNTRSAAAAVARPRAALTARLSGTSMRFLETGLALTAIGAALLIGLGR